MSATQIYPSIQTKTPTKYYKTDGIKFDGIEKIEYNYATIGCTCIEIRYECIGTGYDVANVRFISRKIGYGYSKKS